MAPTGGSLLLCRHLFLSGLLATSSISKGWLSMTPSVMPGVVERVNPCLRPLRATGLKSPVPTKGGMGEQPFLNRDYHTTAAFFLTDERSTVHCLPCLPISTAPDRKEGSLLTPPAQCLRQFSRGLPLTLGARVGFEPRLRLMRAASYHCSTSAILITSLSLSINIIS